MSMRLGTAVVEITGDDSKLAKSLDGAKQKASGLGGVLKTALGTAAGFAGAQAGIQGLSGAFDFLVGNAKDFEKSLDGVQAATGASEEAMASMRKEALRIGKDTSKSASEAVDAMGELAKAGMDIETILNGGAKAAVALAEATGIDVPRAAVLVSDALNTWKGSGLDAAQAANIFAKAANASSISVDDLGMSLSAVGPVAVAAGLSMNDFAIAMGLMGNNALKGSDAGTSLKAFISGLTPASDKAKDSMKALGFTAFDLQGNFKDMPQIVANLSQALEGMTEQQRATTLELWFGSDGVRAANILLKEGTKGWHEFSVAMEEAPDVAEQARIRMDNLAGNIERLKGTIETISITIGTMLLPALNDIALFGGKMAESALGWIEQHQDSINGTLKTLAQGITTVVDLIRDMLKLADDLTGQGDLVALLGLASLALFLVPGAPILLGLAAVALAIGVVTTSAKDLPGPLLAIKLAFFEMAAGVLAAADTMPGWVQKQLGVKDAIDDSRKSLQDEIDAIKGEQEARARADAVTRQEVEGKRLATEAGLEYVDMVRANILAYTNAQGPAQVADEQLRRLYESYIRNGGAAKDLGFEVDALTGAISKVDQPASESAAQVDVLGRKIGEVTAAAPGAVEGMSNMAQGAYELGGAADSAARAMSGLLTAAIDTGNRAVAKFNEIRNAAMTAQAMTNMNPTGYATGGVLRAGELSIVGERGWEPFIPAQDGRVLSHPDAMKALAQQGDGGGEGIQVFMPNATIMARDQQEAANSMQGVGYGISTAAARRGSRR